MRGSDGLAKIGRSMHPEARLKAIAATNAAGVVLHHVTAEREDSSYVEAAAHRLLADKRRVGEWFDVSPSEAVAAVEAAIRQIEHTKYVRKCKGCFPAWWRAPRAPGTERKQINLRVDDELLAMVGELQRLDRSGPTPPTMSEVIRKAVAETLERWRHTADKREARRK